jgi:mono/diheme cytochrome c family protein
MLAVKPQQHRVRVVGMLRSVHFIGLGISVGLLCAAISLASAQTPSSIGRGQFIAEEKCAGCHAMGGGVQGVTAPSFRAIAARPNITAERLRDLITTPKHPMPATPLGSAELDAVVAYIRSLR